MALIQVGRKVGQRYR
jgi:hypothetical protein